MAGAGAFATVGWEFWWAVIASIILMFSWIGFMIGHVLSGGVALDVLKIKAGNKRAVIMPDNSQKAKLESGKWTGTHLDTDQFGMITWTPGAFNFYGIMVGVGDPETGVTISPTIMASLESLKEKGVDGIKEAKLIHDILEKKLTKDNVTKRVEDLKKELNESTDKDHKKVIQHQIKQGNEIIGHLDKIGALDLTLDDFRFLSPMKNTLLNFKELWKWVTHWVNPKMTKLAETDGRLDERKNLEKNPLTQYFPIIFLAIGFTIILFALYIFYVLMTGDQATAQAAAQATPTPTTAPTEHTI